MNLPADLNLHNESDVEQKFIYTLLTSSIPAGLGFANYDFRTKVDIRKIKIDKGAKSAIYYPDYLIIMQGLPLLIIEAKTIGEDLEAGWKEARLYATELNKEYPHGFNSCQKVIVSNGERTIASYWDTDSEKIEFSINDLNISNENFYSFVNFCKKDTLSEYVTKLQKKVRKETKFIKPTSLLGGKYFQESTIAPNSFGENLSIEYKYLFNPESEEERAEVARNAYVSTKKKLAHVRPIDRLIRATLPPSYIEAKTIENSIEPKEIFTVLKDQKKINRQVLLVIGGVGSGKSTFTDYLKEVALPNDIKEKTFWMTLNMNDAPSSKEVIYDWLLNYAIDYIKIKIPEYDTNDYSFISKIFAKQIKEFEKGPIVLLKDNQERYSIELYNFIMSLVNDKSLLFKAITDYLFSNRSKSLIIVLDNVDKRSRDTQLLMFEVSNWLKSTFNCTVFLPLREVTFDHYRKEPPLDTVIKDLVFRIEPPLLEQVIYARFKYALRQIESDHSSFYYYLRNGARVECKRDQVKHYLSSILKTLFQNNFFRRLISGLSERDIRRGLEIFLDFCKSGYIEEDNILKMRINGSTYDLPNHLVTRILLRGDRRYYSDNSSRLKNLFNSYVEDVIPDPFIRLSILQWLKNRFHILGPTLAKGYHKIEVLLLDLVSYGHKESRILIELESLIRANCITTETQSVNTDTENLISITASGIVHLDLLGNIDYLSSVSEDTYFNNLVEAEKIKNNIVGANISHHLNRQVSLENSNIIIDYLIKYKSYFPNNPEIFLDKGSFTDLINISKAKKQIDDARDPKGLAQQKSLLIKKYPRGTVINARISGIKRHGIFFEIGLDARGFIHTSDVKNNDDPSYIQTHYEVGEYIDVEINSFYDKHNNFRVKIV